MWLDEKKERISIEINAKPILKANWNAVGTQWKYALDKSEKASFIFIVCFLLLWQKFYYFPQSPLTINKKTHSLCFVWFPSSLRFVIVFGCTLQSTLALSISSPAHRIWLPLNTCQIILEQNASQTLTFETSNAVKEASKEKLSWEKIQQQQQQ